MKDEILCMNQMIKDRKKDTFEGTLRSDSNEMYVDFFSTERGIACSYSHYIPTKDTELPSVDCHSCVFIHMNLSNKTEFYSVIDNAINVFKKGEYNIGILKDGAKFKVRCTAGLEYRYLTIFLPTELFNEFIHWQGSESFLQGSHTTFFNVVASLPIDSNQLQMVNEIIDFNDKNEAIKELRKESKLLELVISSFDKLRKTGVEHESLKCSLSQKDINLLYSARDYVLRDLRNPPSLKQVSVKIGLNEFKLKRGFKILFGTTIYAMLQDVRLDKAKSLIVEKGYSAKAAGQLVGYKSASHFNKIFKNKFLITPKQLTNQAQI